MKLNRRLNDISEYHFQELDNIRNELIAQGKNVTDLSIGDPDLPVNENIIETLINSLNIKGYNKYPPYDGIRELKEAVIKYYDRNYSVKLSMDEVIILIGSKEGINNIIPAICDIRDYVLIPKPSYPVYETCCKLWGVNYYNINLEEKNNYLPDLSGIPKVLLPVTKLFILNYPNNPTGAVSNEYFYKEAIKFCIRNDIILINDGAYNEVLEENKTPLSLLQLDDKKNFLEFGTLSKIYNMTGFRVGYAVGNSNLIKLLLKVKSNVDSGQFMPIQRAAANALALDNNYINSARRVFFERRSEAEKLLSEHNIKFYRAKGTFYIWCSTPSGYDDKSFCEELIKDYGIIVTPGTVFSKKCTDKFRISLTLDKENIQKALKSLKMYD